MKWGRSLIDFDYCTVQYSVLHLGHRVNNWKVWNVERVLVCTVSSHRLPIIVTITTRSGWNCVTTVLYGDCLVFEFFFNSNFKKTSCFNTIRYSSSHKQTCGIAIPSIKTGQNKYVKWCRKWNYCSFFYFFFLLLMYTALWWMLIIWILRWRSIRSYHIDHAQYHTVLYNNIQKRHVMMGAIEWILYRFDDGNYCAKEVVLSSTRCPFRSQSLIVVQLRLHYCISTWLFSNPFSSSRSQYTFVAILNWTALYIFETLRFVQQYEFVTMHNLLASVLHSHCANTVQYYNYRVQYSHLNNALCRSEYSCDLFYLCFATCLLFPRYYLTQDGNDGQ